MSHAPRGQYLTCENPACAQAFYVQPGEVATRKYCSQSCARRARGGPDRVVPRPRGRRVTLVCQNPACQCAFSVPASEVGRRKFCSRECSSRVLRTQASIDAVYRRGEQMLKELDNGPQTQAKS